MKVLFFIGNLFYFLSAIWGYNSMSSWTNLAVHWCQKKKSFEILQLSPILHCTSPLFLSPSPTHSFSTHGLFSDQSSQDCEHVAVNREKRHIHFFPWVSEINLLAEGSDKHQCQCQVCLRNGEQKRWRKVGPSTSYSNKLLNPLNF